MVRSSAGLQASRNVLLIPPWAGLRVRIGLWGIPQFEHGNGRISAHTGGGAMKRICAAVCVAMLGALACSSLSFAVTMNLMTGREKGTYYQFGLNLQQLVKPKGIELGVQPSTGSIENLYAVFQRPHTQIGIVQSDVLAFVSRLQSNPTLVRIAQKTKMVFPLYNEEVHLLGRRDIADFDHLSGKRVAVGEDGSGTFLTAR